MNKINHECQIKFNKTDTITNETSYNEAGQMSKMLEQYLEEFNEWFKVTMFAKRNGKG